MQAVSPRGGRTEREGACVRWQVCLPVKNLDLGYNLVKTHDGSAAFLVVDHDEEEMITARAPIGNIYAPGAGDMLCMHHTACGSHRR